MPCASFEDLLLDYGELACAEREAVDAHLAGCPACREYLEALAQLDLRLAGLFAGVQASPAFRKRVLARVSLEGDLARPSFLPEVLDFIGWAAILAVVVCLALLLAPIAAMPQFPPEFNTFAALGAAAIAVLAAAWVGARCYADLRH